MIFGNKVCDIIFCYCLHAGRAYFESYKVLDEVMIYEKLFIGVAFNDLDRSELDSFIKINGGHGIVLLYC